MRFDTSLLFIMLVGCASVCSLHMGGYEPNDFNTEDGNDESDYPIEQESHHPHHQFKSPDKKYSEDSDDSEPESHGSYNKHEREDRGFQNQRHRSYPHRFRRFYSKRRSENYVRPGDNDYQDTRDLLPKLYETLNDISKTLKEQNHFTPHPPPCAPTPSPPQIIYFPYSIQPPSFCSCVKQSSAETGVPQGLPSRVFNVADSRQIWGYNSASSTDYDDSQYKPVTFVSAAKHQGPNDLSHSEVPRKESSSKRRPDPAPTICDIAALTCCQTTLEKSKCLEERHCAEDVSCSTENIKQILKKIEMFYVFT